jgi:ABC-2 type transport system permease protein
VNRRAIQAIVRKDLKVVAASKAVLLPLIVVPLIMLLVLPALAALAPGLTNLPGATLTDMEAFLGRMPAGLQAELAPYTLEQRIVVLLLMYLFAPLYLVVPTMIASVIAADSFAGEKERKTLEALVYSPTTDHELFLAKLLSAWLPAVVIAFVGFIVYAVVANLAAWPVMGRVFFPNLTWLALVLWVAPAVAAMGLGSTVLVSSKVKSFQEAYQLGGVVVLPLVLLVVSQAVGAIYISLGLVLAVGLAFWGVSAILLLYGGRSFRRGELMARL